MYFRSEDIESKPSPLRWQPPTRPHVVIIQKTTTWIFITNELGSLSQCLINTADFYVDSSEPGNHCDENRLVGDRCICIDRGHSRPMSSFPCPLTAIAWRHKALCTRTAEAARPIKMTSRFCMCWTYRGRLSGLIGSKLDIDFRRVRRKMLQLSKARPSVCMEETGFLWRNWLRRTAVHADSIILRRLPATAWRNG